jgi:hypothetical protein
MKGQPFLRRLSFAFNEMRLAFHRESNIRFHVISGAAVLLILRITESSALWWAIASVTIGLVVMAELFNSALESKSYCKNCRVLLHFFGLLRTIKNPPSQTACGFLYFFGIHRIELWYRGPESNRHGITTTGF